MINSIKNTHLNITTKECNEIYFGMGCFWGAEKIFWNLYGVCLTAVGYAGGNTVNPTYSEVCTGRTGHAEVVKIVYEIKKIKTLDLLIQFWEGHDPTQGFRQGNDIGPQYRSVIITTNKEQKQFAEKSKTVYEKILLDKGFNRITTEIIDYTKFYFAEDYHQQYLYKNPLGYCGLGGTSVRYRK